MSQPKVPVATNRPSYAEQLASPKWQALRKKLLTKAKFACQQCGAADLPLQVHHLKYVSGRLAWEYHPSLLRVLCVRCHEAKHGKQGNALIPQ